MIDVLAFMVAMSLSLMSQPFAYEFECGYYIDGILIHEATPMHDGKWWGWSFSDRIVIVRGLTDDQKMEVFAHERFHYERLKNGTFDRNNRRHEEELAYAYGFNQSNWDPRILRFSCVD